MRKTQMKGLSARAEKAKLRDKIWRRVVKATRLRDKAVDATTSLRLKRRLATDKTTAYPFGGTTSRRVFFSTTTRQQRKSMLREFTRTHR